MGVDALQSQGMDIDLNPCSDLKGPKGYCRTMEDTSQVGWVIPRSSKNPEGVIRFIDWVQSAWENLHTVQGGFEGDTWKLIKADPENEVWQVESILSEYFVDEPVEFSESTPKGELVLSLIHISVCCCTHG